MGSQLTENKSDIKVHDVGPVDSKSHTPLFSLIGFQVSTSWSLVTIPTTRE